MSLIASHVSELSEIGVQVSELSDIAVQVSDVSLSSSHFRRALTAMDDTAVNATAPDCLLMASMTMVLVLVTAKPEFPMMLVDTANVDVSVMVATPMAYLVAAMATVLVSLMAAAPMAYRRPLMAMELVLEIARGVD